MSMSSSVRLSSVCNVRAPYTQAIEIFGNISTPSDTRHPGKILRRSSQGTSGELNTTGVAEYSDFGPIERYISETVKYRS